MNEDNNSCRCLTDFLRAQKEIIERHIDEHKYLRHIDDKNEAIGSFVHDFGWIIRELYCTKICGKRDSCKIAGQLSASGDLLRNHVKEVKNET